MENPNDESHLIRDIIRFNRFRFNRRIPMITTIPSNERHFADAGWLQTYWHFSFSEYYDPNNMNWSALRVFNDDVVQPAGGFGMHPHRDMEIVTYVVDGQ